ncbi:MAG: TonB-dependent receptor [Chitinophagaceae bacterium]|nr:TonB-dependent receptor [Chitinophagaceae bacterium]
MRTILTILLHSCILFNLQAQSSISGKLTDQKQKPLKSFTVLLLKQSDSSLVKSTLTNESAVFTFKEISNGNYLILANGLSYEKNYTKVIVAGKDQTVPHIILKVAAVNLGEVTVTARKPFLEQRADKLVVNVEGSATAAGSTALEVLQKVPGVIVRNEQVTLAGKSSVNIMINGKTSQYTDINQVLATTAASNIEKIELISNPGARYDAAGGAIINIILKKNADMGTNGTVSVSGAMGLYKKDGSPIDRNFYRLTPYVSINNRKGKVNVYGNINLFHRNLFNYEEFERVIPPSRFLQTKYNPNNRNSSSYRAGLDFYADDKNTFGILYRGYALGSIEEAVNNTQEFNSNTGILQSTFQTLNNNHIKRVNQAGNMNWKHVFDTTGKELNVDLDYSNYQMNNTNDIKNVLSNGNYTLSTQSINNPVHFTVGKIDYTHPIDKDTKFELGSKLSFATIDNAIVFKNGTVVDPKRSTNFQYKENINAIYSSFIKKMGGWELNAGLRVEQTIATGESEQVKVLDRNYTKLFPSFFITRKLDKNLSTVFQYSKRLNRPSYQQQNPFIEYADSLTYSKGNPLINPEMVDAYKLGLTFQNQPFFSVSYNKTKDVIFNSAPKQDGNQTYVMPENLGTYENITFELNFPLNFGKKISGYGGNHLIYNHYKADYLGGIYDQSKWNWQAYWQVAYKPKPSWNIEVSGFYTTKFLEEFLTINPLGSLNLAIQKSFWEKKGKLTLNFNDLLFSEKSTAMIDYQYINIKVKSQSESRNVRLAFTYSFGNQKLKATRSRESASDAESNRVKSN